MKIQLPQISEMLQINVKLVLFPKKCCLGSILLFFGAFVNNQPGARQPNNQTNNNNKTANKPLGAINIPELCKLLVH